MLCCRQKKNIIFSKILLFYVYCVLNDKKNQASKVQLVLKNIKLGTTYFYHKVNKYKFTFSFTLH